MLPLLLAVVLVLVQVGLLMRDYVLVVHATREAARAAAVTPTVEAARTAAVAATGLDPTRLHVGVAGGRVTGSRLQVTVLYHPEPAIPIVGRLFSTVRLEEKLTVRVE